MLKGIIICLASVLLLSCLTAQPEIVWERSIGGSDKETVQDFILTEDGGFLLVGSTLSSDYHVSREKGEGDLWLVKLNSLGLIEWEKNYNHSAEKVLQTEDKGYLVLGNIDLGDSLGMDFWLLKVDSIGEYEWDISLGGTRDDIANDFIQLSDGGFAIIGKTHSIDDFEGFHGLPEYSDFGVIKIDSEMNICWKKAFGGSNRDVGQSILQLPPENNEEHGDLILYGITDSEDGDVNYQTFLNDWLLLEIEDSTGIFDSRIVISGGCTEDASDFLLTAESKKIGLGRVSHYFPCEGTLSDTFPGGVDWTLFNVGAGPNWYRVIGGELDDQALNVINSSNGKILVAGYSNSKQEIVWEFIPPPNNFNITTIGADTNIGEYDYWIMQFDEEGNYEWSKKLGGTDFDQASDIIEVDTNTYLIAGISESVDGDVSQSFLCKNSIWLVKIGQQCSIEERPSRPDITSGDAILCNTDNFVLNATPFEGTNVTYHWETPTGVFTTEVPSLELNNISKETHSGIYSLLVKIDDCVSPVSVPVIIEVLEEDIFTMLDFSSCQDEVLISGSAPVSGLVTGEWSSDEFVDILNHRDSTTFVQQLQPGFNELIWSFSALGCPDFIRDTLTIIYEKPIATDDIVNYGNGTSYLTVDVLANDVLEGISELELRILEPPFDGEVIITNIHQIIYNGFSSNSSITQLTYEVCNALCLDLCDTASIILNNTELSIPQGITPNGDNKNDFLIIEGLTEVYPNHQLFIYNRWGEEVFQASPYQNDWEGTRDGEPLPEGVYYYFIELGEGIKPLRGSIHLFR